MMLYPAPANGETRQPHRHDTALAYLRLLLLDGGLEPNDIISTDGIGKALNISRAPVTDAIKRLVSDGFVTVIPQVGCRIVAPQPGEVADFYRLFAKSEAVILGLAAERCRPADAAALTALTKDLDRQYTDIAGSKDSGPALRALNRRRYEALHRLAASRIAGELVVNMWDRSDFYIRIAYGSFVYGAKIHRRNQEICKAIAMSDASTAMRLTESYLTDVGDSIAAHMAKRRLSHP